MGLFKNIKTIIKAAAAAATLAALTVFMLPAEANAATINLPVMNLPAKSCSNYNASTKTYNSSTEVGYIAAPGYTKTITVNNVTSYYSNNTSVVSVVRKSSNTFKITVKKAGEAAVIFETKSKSSGTTHTNRTRYVYYVPVDAKTNFVTFHKSGTIFGWNGLKLKANDYVVVTIPGKSREFKFSIDNRYIKCVDQGWVDGLGNVFLIKIVKTTANPVLTIYEKGSNTKSFTGQWIFMNV